MMNCLIFQVFQKVLTVIAFMILSLLKPYDAEPQKKRFDQRLLSDDSSTNSDGETLRITNTD